MALQSQVTTAPALPSNSTPLNDQEVDVFLRKLLNVGQPKGGMTKDFTQLEIVRLCMRAKKVFSDQSMLLELDAPVKVCGDLHGQFGDLIRLFHACGVPPTSNYLFLGDYVDRGRHNLETICLQFCFKASATQGDSSNRSICLQCKYPNNFFLLRGNHECRLVNHVYGFFEECNRRFPPVEGQPSLWHCFQDVFNMMPLAAIISDRILCMHGGISPQLTSLNDIRKIQRPLEPAGQNLAMDLMWADPMVGLSGTKPNQRGASIAFGEDELAKTCQRLNIDFIARAHQVVQDGFELFGNRKLVTLFSAPHYCGQFDNNAAVMVVDENLQCSFQVLRPLAPLGTAAPPGTAEPPAAAPTTQK